MNNYGIALIISPTLALKNVLVAMPTINIHHRIKPAVTITTIFIIAFFLLNIPIAIHLPPISHAASFTLYGRVLAPAGWGTSPTTVTNPGPDLIVMAGETVTLTLFAADSVQHRFCVDYEAVPDFICQGNETPTESPAFSSATVATHWTFTANTIPGNYTYYCTIHQDAMEGLFRVLPVPDVGVANIVTSRIIAYSGVTANPTQVNVTASNPGTNTQTFFVSAKANSTLIENQTVTLNSGQTKTVSFQWDPSSLPRGNYIITSQATKVTGEVNFANNSATGPTFALRFKGDVNGDCKVDIIDLSTVGAAFGSTNGSPAYKPAADLNNDGTINIVDLVLVAGAFGQSCT